MSELQVFVDCLRRETEPSVSSADAGATVAVAVTAARSIEEGAPVEVTLESRQHAGAGREPPRSGKGVRGEANRHEAPTGTDD
jgi:hypothetical protein